MKQKRDKPFRTFAARVRGKGETCGFITKSACNCGRSNLVDFTSHIVCDVLIAGVYDPDIQRDLLGVEGVVEKQINEVISLVEKTGNGSGR